TLLALSLANGATGYSLPWDARAFFSTRVAESVAGGLPLVGANLRAWLVGGSEISTLTLSRFFALHALLVPFLLLAVACARLLIFREPGTTLRESDSGFGELDAARAETDHAADAVLPRTRAAWARAQLARNAVVAGVLFLALALYAYKYPAPLGPAAEAAPPGYLPRPGAQFVWLFQLLKLFPKTFGSVVAFFLPALLLAALACLPLSRTRMTHASEKTRRRLGQAVLSFTVLLVASLTAVAYLQDSRDPRAREQLAKQAQK